MSEFKNINFVNEFAYRTKLNYFYQKERFSEGEEKEQAKKDVQRTIANMERQGFNIAPYYEVTDIINSLIGLLIFPEQNVFEKISAKKAELKKIFPKLYLYTQKKDKYRNTYPEKQIHWGNGRKKMTEKESPREICKRLRNSLCHWNVSIEPHAATISGTRQIISVEFKDEGRCKDEFDIVQNGEFSLTINVEDLEGVFMEICDYLINLKG